jgi:hypothetical protein
MSDNMQLLPDITAGVFLVGSDSQFCELHAGDLVPAFNAPSSFSFTILSQTSQVPPEALRMPAAEVARQALELLRRDGWGQYEAKRSDGTRCALGAISAVLIGEETDNLLGAEKLLRPFADVIMEQWPEFTDSAKNPCVPAECSLPVPRALIVLWNDCKGRTFGDVERLFEKVAAREEA